MISVLEYCLETKMFPWAKTNIFDIFQQLIMLDADLGQYIDQFIAYLNTNFTTLSEIAFAMLECNRLN